ncbi:MAG: phospho-sugar mutase [Clostridia bacterium]|nr:phospho-sugar mutase [Clostridia bacterium]
MSTAYETALKEYENWLSHVEGEDKAALEAIRGDENAILARFAIPMAFGTAGLRSTMDLGISRMNVYTVAQTTKGLADLVLEAGGKDRGVAISYDSRNRSELFAHTAARVLAACGIKVYLFDGIRPTPELSFAILHYGCIAGINVTASHNPKEYNGYKVYWEDGAQLPPEHAEVVSKAAAATDIFSVELADLDKAVADGIVTIIGKEADEAFLSAVLNCALAPDLTAKYGNGLNMFYTPLHGTGYKLIPECLRRCGITNLQVVEEQAEPNGDFPTVASPNPENKECFALAAEKIKQQGLNCNMIIASDPDADRVGLALRGKDGEFFALNGNQIGALLIDYIIKVRKEKGILPENGCAIKSIVSSNLFDAICDAHGVDHVSVLTGFKYIGEKIKQWKASGEHTFIFGYEESQGYLSDGYARDKDAIAAAMLIAEMACYHAAAGKTVAEALDEIYATYGCYRESVINLAITGLDPMGMMKEQMAAMRANAPRVIGGLKVVRVRDYKDGKVYHADGNVTETGLPSSDVLYYELESGDAVIVRPSGTEPKIKVYILAKGENEALVAEKIGAFTVEMKAKLNG